MSTRRAAERPLLELLARARYEVFPAAGIEDDVAEHVPTSVKVTVTSSPTKGLDATLALTERLAQHGFHVVPHLAARLIVDGPHLRRVLERLKAAGVHEVFVVAGDSDEPMGQFPDALALLQGMREVGHGLDEVGIAGYPESHPAVADEQMMQAMLDKAPLATYIVSQVCFDPKVIADWITVVRRLGAGIPIYVGIPGVVERSRLLRIATKIGVGESGRFLRKHRNWLVHLMLPSMYSPDRLIHGLDLHVEGPGSPVMGLHVYTFNAVVKTEAWRRAKLESAGLAG